MCGCGSDGRARRVSRLRPGYADDREVIATAPSTRKLTEAVAFAHQRADWIGKLIADLPTGGVIAPGMTIEVMGLPLHAQRSAGPGAETWSRRSHPRPGHGARFAADGGAPAQGRGSPGAGRAHRRIRRRPEPPDAGGRGGRSEKPLGLVPPAALQARAACQGGGRPHPLVFLAPDPGPLRGAGLCRRPRVRPFGRGQSRAWGNSGQTLRRAWWATSAVTGPGCAPTPPACTPSDRTRTASPRRWGSVVSAAAAGLTEGPWAVAGGLRAARRDAAVGAAAAAFRAALRCR